MSVRKTLYMLLLLLIVTPITALLVDKALTVDAATTVKIDKSKVTLYVGQTYSLKITGTSDTVTWTTSKKSVAKVSSSGKVTAMNAGKATITATVNKKKYTCNVTVKYTTGVEHVKSVSAVNKVFSDGLKTTAVAIEYDQTIMNSKLSKTAYTVEGKIITKVYANTEATTASKGANGKYVIIELSTDYNNAVTKASTENVGFVPNGNPPGGAAGIPSDISQTSVETSITPEDRVKHPGIILSSTNGGDGLSVTVTQIADIITKDGAILNESATVLNNQYDVNLVIDDFMKPDFTDANYPNNRYKFNLYVPADYDSSKSYPLVLFMQDEDSIGRIHAASLVQGLGGVVWAEASEQAKHECLVLVPSFTGPFVEDDYITTSHVDETVDLIKYLETQYSIDQNRLYVTGQSAGCGAAMAMNLKYPDLFAASLLFAGDWNPQAMVPLKNANMWIVVSEGDETVYQNMNSCISSLDDAGAKISTAKWNAQVDNKMLADYVSKMIEEGNNIKYTILQKGTLVPNGVSDDTDNNHTYTWRLGYTIEGLRDWLFTQHK